MVLCIVKSAWSCMGIVIIWKHIEIIYIILPVELKYGVRDLERETVMAY